jgi:predicted AAA+ superfamily ATPase
VRRVGQQQGLTGNPVKKPDGTIVRTLWGELVWQLGGKKAFERVPAEDEKATSPGDVLRELFNEYGPCLILIDEWVAYARILHDQGDLPAGGFETQFTFAQALTESAKAAKNCLLVISLPASDPAGSPHTQADDVEVETARTRSAGQAPQRRRSRRILVAAGERRGRFRDRAPTPIRAVR